MNNANNLRFTLDPTHGVAKKISCPACGKSKCFKRYVDLETGNNLSDDCGRCDHEQSCGYHKTPREYFQEHPEVMKQLLGREPKEIFPSANAIPTKKCNVLPPPVVKTFTMQDVLSHHQPDGNFMQWLNRVVKNPECVQQVFDDYLVGTTKDGVYQSKPIIFWYIDEKGVVHDGKFMWYKPDGHRQQCMNWASSRMIKAGLWPKNAVTTKCLFGLNLLPKYPDRTVFVVESEKSALFCACFYPDSLWLATGGCGGLTAEKLAPLKGRRVIVIPDSGKYVEWSEKMRQTEGIDYSIVSTLEAYPANTDLVDVRLGETKKTQTDEAEAIFDEMCSEYPELRQLQQALDLVPCSSRRIRAKPQPKP